ncbi:hypothetical protein V5O48_017130 [Marasmius crinis-equi]|uniref:AB hydrolase-1 domain-containing protein n=1 Tax=Marasmius crinis-equi TaxID=585013 RepID=A0ABR3EQ22_9AGAR
MVWTSYLYSSATNAAFSEVVLCSEPKNTRLSISSFTATLALALPLASMVSGATNIARRDILDPSDYKNTTVSRGIKYSYYFSPPTDNKRFLLFLHGWPGFSYDWRYQVEFFKEAGYGIIVPDLLGYGGTEKPTDPEAYRSSLISRDIVDILDFESVSNDVVVVGHDWGSKATARIANYFPDRFSAFGFLAVGNLPTAFFTIPYPQLNNATKTALGYEEYGYWDFLTRPGTDEVLGTHLESFFSLAHTGDAVQALTDWAPLGALEAWVTNDRKASTTVVTPEEEDRYLKAYSIPGALEASLAWYKVVVQGIEAQDNEGIPEENLTVVKPVFLGATLRDFVVIAPSSVRATLDTSSNATIHLYDTGHWVQWEAKDELNRDLQAWIEGL